LVNGVEPTVEITSWRFVVAYRDHPPAGPLLIGYDPVIDLPQSHLARLVDRVVDNTVVPPRKAHGKGQPQFDPRLCLKVLVYAYAIGVRSSRQIERLCKESLPFLFLTRGDAPSYRTLCTARNTQRGLVESVWVALFAVAAEAGISRLGKIVVDSTKMRANVSPEAVVKASEFGPVLAELRRIVSQAEALDRDEDSEGACQTTLDKNVEPDEMRDVLRRVRKELARQKRKRSSADKSSQDPSAETEAGTSGEDGASDVLSDQDTEQADAPESTAGEKAALQTEQAKSDLVLVPEPASAPKGSGRTIGSLSKRMYKSLKRAIAAIISAQADQRKHAMLTDPDSRMMGEGREKRIRACHSFEVATDNGLLVAGQRCPVPADNDRLEGLVGAAQRNEVVAISAVDADSGYYAGDAIALLIASGIDTCVPDSNTAGDLHRNQPIGTVRAMGRGSVEFTWDEDADAYRCPEGNRLRFTQERKRDGSTVRVYRAERKCTGCPLAAACLKQTTAKRRTILISIYDDILEQARQRFSDPVHQDRYHHRAEAVETVFGFIRSALGYGRWMLRGEAGVRNEIALITAAYQFRKIHQAIAR
jgi:L-lactate utilization protein LutC